MKKTIIITALLASTLTVNAAELYTAEDVYVLDAGIIQQEGRQARGIYFDVDNIDLPVDCPDGRILIRPMVTEPGSFAEVYSAGLLDKPISITFFINEYSTICILKEIHPEAEEWILDSVRLSPYITDKRFTAIGCPNPMRSGQLGYMYRTKSPGDKSWGTMYGGHMYQVSGTSCQSGPFDLRIREDEQVQWRVETTLSRTDWKEIRD